MELIGMILLKKPGDRTNDKLFETISSRSAFLARIKDLRRFGWNVYENRILAYNSSRLSADIVFSDPFTYQAIYDEIARVQTKRYGGHKKRMRCIEMHRLILKEMEP